MLHRKHIWLVCIGWTFLCGLSAGMTFNAAYNTVLEQFRSTADMALEKDLIFRRWNALRGGVYVQVDEFNMPNPYLDIPDREILTSNGQLLTLVNPAYMTRQVHELQQYNSGVAGHITSLKPLRPENTPDPWERAALESFENGTREAWALFTPERQEYFRFMRPMITEQSCLKCHGQQGYVEGDIRGGISITLPVVRQLSALRSYAAEAVIGYIGIWATGIVIAVLAGARIVHSVRKEQLARIVAETANEHLTASTVRFRALFAAVSDPVLVANRDTGTIVECNDAAVNFFGRSKDELMGLPQRELHPHNTPCVDGMTDVFRRLAINPEQKEESLVITAGGDIRHVEITASKFDIGETKLILGVFHDETEKRSAQDALRESEQRFRSLFSEMISGFSLHEIICNEHGHPIDYRFLEVNPAFERLTGIRASELVGHTVLEVMPRTEKIWIERYGEVALSGVPAEFEEYSSELGRWYEVKAFKAAPGQFAVIFIDTTARKKSQLRLVESENRFRRLVEHAPLPLCFVDQFGTFSYLNRRFLDTFGYTEEDVPTLREWWLQACPDDSYRHWAMTAWAKAIERASANHADIEPSEYLITCKDGARRLMLIGGIFLDSGILATFIDITERKKIEENLNAALKEKESFFEAIAQPAMVLSKDLRVLFLNSAAAASVGKEAHKLIGSRCHSIFHCMDFPPDDCPTSKLLAGKVNGPVQMEMAAAGKIFLVTVTPLYDESGEIDRIVHVATDISKLKETENKLLLAKDEAEGASRAKSEFLANMSHEIRTPLNGLLGMLQLIKSSVPPGELETYSDMGLRAGQRLTSLLGDILDLSRIEAGRMPLHKADFSMPDILQALTETFSPLHYSKSLPLRIEMSPDTPLRIIGDEVRVRQILFNLVGNAMKFTDNGEVNVYVSKLQPTTEGLERLLFIVMDTGPGIPADKIGQVCAPFVQVDDSLTRSHQGAGLGLTIVKKLVDALGGTLAFESEQGHGTSVYVMLPFSLPKQSSSSIASRTDKERPYTLRPVRVLLVEDDEVSRRSGRWLLEKLGHEVDTAQNGLEALETLRGRMYNCVLMDIQMDVMDGLEATKLIRSGTSGVLDPQVPIIAMTAYAMSGDREACLAIGMDAYISKPVHLIELENALGNVLANIGSI